MIFGKNDWSRNKTIKQTSCAQVKDNVWLVSSKQSMSMNAFAAFSDHCLSQYVELLAYHHLNFSFFDKLLPSS